MEIPHGPGYGNPCTYWDPSLFRIWKSLFVSFQDMEIPLSSRIWKSSCLSGYGDPALIKRLDMEILCVLRDIICIWNPWHSWRIRKSLRCDTSRLELAQPSVKSAYHSSLQDTMPLSFILFYYLYRFHLSFLLSLTAHRGFIQFLNRICLHRIIPLLTMFLQNCQLPYWLTYALSGFRWWMK